MDSAAAIGRENAQHTRSHKDELFIVSLAQALIIPISAYARKARRGRTSKVLRGEEIVPTTVPALNNTPLKRSVYEIRGHQAEGS
jgi:hypothetical protein